MISKLIIFALCMYVPLTIKLLLYSIPVNSAQLQKEVVRADIVDVNGVILATTISTHSVYIVPPEVLEPAKIVSELSAILNMPRDYISMKLNARSKKFAWIVRHIAPWQAKEIAQLGFSGVYIAKDMRRFYPLSSMFLHIVGRVDGVNNGISGVELAYDEYLKNNQIPLKLSLNANVQFVLKRALDECKKEFSAKAVYGIIACAKTGRILASYSQCEDFDMNPHETYLNSKGSINCNINLNLQAVAERGSVFKVINAAMLIENGLVNLQTRVVAPPRMKVGWHTITDFPLRSHAHEFTFEESFVKSSDIVNAKLVLQAGIERQVAFFKKVGFYEHMTIDNLDVAQGLLPKKWTSANSITATYGYGLAFTSAQYLRGFLRIISGFDKNLHILQNYSQTPEKRIISQRTVDILRYLLRRGFIENMYGKRSEVVGYNIGGKTGTANKLINGKYVEKINLCSYVFLFPANDPQIIGIISVDEGRPTSATYGFATAGFIAAPIGGKIVKQIGPILGIMKSEVV